MGNILYKKEEPVKTTKISYESLYTITCNNSDVEHVIGLILDKGATFVSQTKIDETTTCILVNGSNELLSIQLPSNSSICGATRTFKQ